MKFPSYPLRMTSRARKTRALTEHERSLIASAESEVRRREDAAQAARDGREALLRRLYDDGARVTEMARVADLARQHVTRIVNPGYAERQKATG